MSDFNRIVTFVLAAEGVRLRPDGTLDETAQNPTGYVVDAGGPTRFGISSKANPDVDVEHLTLDGAKKLYRDRYWTPHGLDAVADPWAYFLFDAYVQHGSKAVEPWRAFNRLSDAVWARLRYYATLKTFPNDGRGWVRRMANLRDTLGNEYGVWT